MFFLQTFLYDFLRAVVYDLFVTTVLYKKIKLDGRWYTLDVWPINMKDYQPQKESDT